MSNSLNSEMLQYAARIGPEYMVMHKRLIDAFTARYGATYHEANSTELMEILDFKGGMVDLAECDRLMSECGFPVITRINNETTC